MKAGKRGKKKGRTEEKRGREGGREKGRKMRSIFLIVEYEIKIKTKSSIQWPNVYYGSVTSLNSVVSSLLLG